MGIVVKVHKIKCNTPEENGFLSDGDEVWARMESGNKSVYEPSQYSYHSSIGEGSIIECKEDFQLESPGSITFDLFDDDGLGSPSQTDPVTARSKELLGNCTWNDASEEVEEDWIKLSPPSDDYQPDYEICYTLKKY